MKETDHTPKGSDEAVTATPRESLACLIKMLLNSQSAAETKSVAETITAHLVEFAFLVSKRRSSEGNVACMSVESKTSETSLMDVVVSIMRRHADSTQVQDFGCLVLQQLASSDDTKLAAVDVVLSSIERNQDQPMVKEKAVEALRSLARSGSIDFLVSIMKRHAENAVIQEVFCQSIRHCAATNEFIARIAAQRGLVDAVVAAMTLHEDNAVVQEHGCASLAHLTGFDDTVISAESGATSVIIAAMRQNAGNVVIQEHGSRVLRNWTDSITNRAAVVTQGGIDVIVAAMKSYSRNSMVQRYGCGALRNVSCLDTGRVCTIEVGGANSVISAMQTNPKDLRLQHDGCSAMMQLSVDGRSKSLTGMKAVIAAMREHNESSNLQSEACVALIRWADNTMVEMGAIDVVVAAMQEFRSDEELQHRCIIFLELLSLDENAKFSMLAVGGTETLLGVTRHHIAVLKTVHRSIRVLYQLAKIPMGKHYIRAIGGVALVEAALRAHPNARSFHERGKMLLAQLRS